MGIAIVQQVFRVRAVDHDSANVLWRSTHPPPPQSIQKQCISGGRKLMFMANAQ